MATKGVEYQVIAPIVDENEGGAIQYGTPRVLEEPIAIDVSYTFADGKLWAGNKLKLMNNGVNGGTVAVDLLDISDDDEVAFLGKEQIGESPDQEYEKTSESSKPVGYGYVELLENTTGQYYDANLLHKVMFKRAEKNAATGTENVEYLTPKLEGELMGVQLDATGKKSYHRNRKFTTLAAAKAWINGKLGIPVTQVATPAATPGAGAVAAETEVALATSTSGATIYYTTDGSTPTEGSMVYTEPLTIYGPVTIKAMAAKAGMANSAVLSAAYTITA